MNLFPSHRDYLLSRTYDQSLLDKEEICSQGEDTIEWTCRAPSGALIGHQTRSATKHRYIWNQAVNAQHLPIMYGTKEDHELLYKTGRVILVEGVFDRAALKLIAPDCACYARLSKGVSKSLLGLLQRYASVVFLCFDQDQPGQEATIEAEKRLRGIDTHVIKFPAKDPAEYAEKVGCRRAASTILPQIKIWE
jgi:5S rRNA maturation endonuclease (ribonuclease M5)